MRNADEYLRYASECVELARRSNDPETKARLLQVAEAWRELAAKLEPTGNQREE
jgi:hypothetical protein